MMDDPTPHLLIEAASALLHDRGDGVRHTVASAARTNNGQVFTSLNVSHFTGGMCAEISLLARLIPENEEPQIIVTIGDEQRGVIAPCGKCRQILLDYFPKVEIIMPDGTRKTPIQLLPDVYMWRE